VTSLLYTIRGPKYVVLGQRMEDGGRGNIDHVDEEWEW